MNMSCIDRLLGEALWYFFPSDDSVIHASAQASAVPTEARPAFKSMACLANTKVWSFLVYTGFTVTSLPQF